MFNDLKYCHAALSSVEYALKINPVPAVVTGHLLDNEPDVLAGLGTTGGVGMGLYVLGELYLERNIDVIGFAVKDDVWAVVVQGVSESRFKQLLQAHFYARHAINGQSRERDIEAFLLTPITGACLEEFISEANEWPHVSGPASGSGYSPSSI